MGGLAALRPEDIDLDACTVRVTRQLYYHEAGYSFRPPKSRAGLRVVAFPDLIVPDVRKHLGWLPSSGALVFASSTGSPLSHSNVRNRIWLPAMALSAWRAFTFTTCGTPGTSSPPTRARLRELMARMGHDSERAALIYQHSTAARQRALADAVGKTARAELARSKKGTAAKPSARNGHETAVRPLKAVYDLRPDRDSNAGPTA